MAYFLIVIAIVCLVVIACAAALLRFHNFWVLAGIDFLVTLSVLYGVLLWTATQASSRAELFWTSFSVAAVCSLMLLAVRYADQHYWRQGRTVYKRP